MSSRSSNHQMRVIHRYLGFFLSGVMAVYAVSGIIMIFRNTDFLKKEVVSELMIDPGLTANEIGPKVKIRGLKFDKQVGDVLYSDKVEYNIQTGRSLVKKMELPFILEKMTKMHKATTNSPLFYLNIFFGISLLFFVISSFWMFFPGSTIFKKGVYFTIAGIVLTLIILFV